MGLQGRTASGYTGEALPAQANWAGKTRCWLVCHALCSHPPDLSFVVAAMHLACASTAMLSPFHVVPCSWGVDASRIEIRTPCEGTGTSCMYSTVLPQLQCGSAPCPALLDCHRSRRDAPLGLPYRPLQSGLPTADQHLVDSSASSRPHAVLLALELSPQVQ